MREVWGFRLGSSLNATNDSIAVCKSCRTVLGRYGDLKANANKLAAAEGKRLGNTFFETIMKRHRH